MCVLEWRWGDGAGGEKGGWRTICCTCCEEQLIPRPCCRLQSRVGIYWIAISTWIQVVCRTCFKLRFCKVLSDQNPPSLRVNWGKRTSALCSWLVTLERWFLRLYSGFQLESQYVDLLLRRMSLIFNCTCTHMYTCVGVNMLYVKFWTFISEALDWKWEFHLIYCHMIFACICICY